MGSSSHGFSFLGQLLENLEGHHASTLFDRDRLVEAHEKKLDHIVERPFRSNFSFTFTSLTEHWRPAVAMRGLAPIRARDLQIDKIHHGRVLFGTLCVHAQKWVSVMTLLEDRHGDAVRLAIYNHSQSTTEDASQAYPKGAKVAVKEPFFKMATDGALLLRIDNCENVEILNSFPGSAETVCGSVSDSGSGVDVGKFRAEGNARFRERNWKGAILCYSKCIDSSLSLHTGGAPHSVNIKDALLFSYSNRAEANLKLKKLAPAVEDCDKALEIDSAHVKSIFRKGRALRALGEYNLACCCHQKAFELCPDSTEIKSEYEECKQLNDQNLHGKFDLSSYFLKGCKPENVPDKLSNYIGPVTVKTSIGCGRGLFATEQVNIGEILLVENAIAVRDSQTEGNSIKKVISEVNSCAMSSPRLLKQLLCLVDVETLQVPDMDLFRVNNGSWNKFDAGGNSEQDMDALKNAMESNLLLTLTFTEDDYGVLNAEEDSRLTDKKCGFSVLPSFINHSCFPNAKCMVVGKAMFVLAVREIGIGEEITVSYFSSLMPLEGREAMCSLLGFQCDCERCLLERSMGPRFIKLARSIFNMEYMDPPQTKPETYMQSLVKFALQLEKQIEASQERNLITLEGKQLIRASFPRIYCVIFELASKYPHFNVPSSLLSLKVEMAEAMDHAVPGCIESFQLFASLVDKSQRKDSRQVYEKAKKVAMKFFGRQKGHVIRDLLKAKPRGRTVIKLVGIAVKEPYFKMVRHGAPVLRTDDQANVEILNYFLRGKEPACVGCLEMGKLQAEGHARFTDKDWNGAILYYSKFIDVDGCLHLRGGLHCLYMVDALRFSYSHMAEAYLQLKECVQAIKHCDKALEIDAAHVKSLFRKGRALRALGEYNSACCCHQQALELCPDSTEIKSEYEDCKQLNDQNLHGKFDLSSYFLNGCRPEDVPDKLSNYIGPVTVKKSVGCGRGLFATKQVNVGDVLLVENAIAVTDWQRKAGVLQTALPNGIKNIISEVSSCAMSSPRILKQLLCLADVEMLQVPDMDLFPINNNSWNKFDGGGNSDLEMDVLENAMLSNLLLTSFGTVDYYSFLQVEGESRVTYEKCGFWALSSFINHSCFPNAKCMVVGKAMFVLAVREIRIGEEITVSYFSSMPLEGREAMCSLLGIQCDCKRCVLERRMGPRFNTLAASIFNMDYKERPKRTIEEAYMKTLVKIALQLEKEIDAAQKRNLITFEGKQLIRASFQDIYCSIFYLGSQYPQLNVPSSLLSLEVEVAEAMDYAVPGCIESFQMFASIVENPQRKDSRLVYEKATRVATKCFGRQKDDVIRDLLKTKPRLQLIVKFGSCVDADEDLLTNLNLYGDADEGR